eukprot:1412848-Prorocentrum_lima.AAC.1
MGWALVDGGTGPSPSRRCRSAVHAVAVCRGRMRRPEKVDFEPGSKLPSVDCSGAFPGEVRNAIANVDALQREGLMGQ